MKYRTLKSVLKSIAISVAIYLVASFVIVMILYEGIFSRVEEYEYNSFITYEDMLDYSPSEITFVSRDFNLSGVFYETGTSDKVVIFGHGKGGSGEDMLPEARYFLDNGYSALVFDYTGCGKSGGSSQVGFQQPVYCFIDAVKYVQSIGYNNIFLYGYGVGGYAAAACADIEGVKAVASIASFSTVQDMTLEYAASNMGIFGYLEYPVMLLYQFLVYGEDINDNAVQGINNSTVPIFIVNGTDDKTILYNGAALINSKNKITNPAVMYKTIENGRHGSLMRSENANTLLDKFNEEAYELYNSYSGNVPVSEIEKFYSSYSREDMSELNLAVMGEILDLFNSADLNGSSM